MDRDALKNAPTLQTLQKSGLLKFFYTSNMWANVHLLEHLISYWDHNLGDFDLQGEILEVIVEDMYFIIGFSYKGMSMNLEGICNSGDLMSVKVYFEDYYSLGM